MPNKITDALQDAIAGRASRITTYIITDLREARRLAQRGYKYVWEMDGDRPTGRCIVTVPADMSGTANVSAV
ncbi:MAG: hypothetical protein LC750_00630 [Actinobacteria bacterium]|nr:hypothetical protein [Actinomycetota bacterium]